MTSNECEFDARGVRWERNETRNPRFARARVSFERRALKHFIVELKKHNTLMMMMMMNDDDDDDDETRRRGRTNDIELE